MGPQHVQQFAQTNKPSLMRTAARWRLDEPEKWLELLVILKIDPEIIERRNSQIVIEMKNVGKIGGNRGRKNGEVLQQKLLA